MSIFDIFTFKRDAGKIFIAENFHNILEVAKEAIIGEIKSNIPGQEKKAVVDAIVLTKMDALALTITNKWVLWVFKLVEQAVPTITQLVYDFLKEKVENL